MSKTTTRGAVNALAISDPGHFTFSDASGIKCSARFDLFLIKLAWENGCNMEDLADGFGAGLGTCGGDWSGIRDSSDEATLAMAEKALGFIANRVGHAQRLFEALKHIEYVAREDGWDQHSGPKGSAINGAAQAIAKAVRS